ncbi:MAG: protein kinase [Bacteriovoracaceae bacterium]|nr:protein kinase [Bacteriovoracaceae bacterium]
MSVAKKQDIQEPAEESDELQFDVQNDWRVEADKSQSSIFKEDDLEVPDEELDISELTLDISGEVAKKSALEQAREQRKANQLARKNDRKAAQETLKSLQDSVDGAVSDDDELEILNEEESALVNDPILSNKGDQYPQIHGNYFLLDHLVDGGMAKVCRARYLGEGDEADKMVAIKMVQEKFSADEDFVQMFVDEIKVSFGLNHPNINTTFDYGKIGKNLFVSMEYIHGKDLMVVIDELKKKKKTIPIPMCIYIASKMCEALHYAHNFTNKLTGQKYNIVHRDISPHNAMVSYEGYVKVIDFGIAKADTNTTEEAEGTIKGKINYFAPEYLEGKKINHRYDQFAVALTLWEMLTGEKTFKGADQLLTLKTILECNPDLPSKHNKEVPKALDKLIMKALSKDPGNRFKDMQAFNKELMKLLYQTYPDFHESDVSEMMKVLFKESYEKDLEKFKGFGQYSIAEIVEKINAFKEFQKRQKEKAQRANKGAESMFDFGFTEESISARGKKGMDKLITGKKKEKPGNGYEKNQRKKQRALASLLEDDDYVKPISPFEQHKGKLIFFSLLFLGFFQKELILKTFFGDDDTSTPITKRTKSKGKTNNENKALRKAKSKHESSMDYVNNLKAKAKEESNIAPAKVESPAPPPVAKVVRERVQESANAVTPPPAPVKVKKERELVDLQEVSIEDLKRNMEKQIEERKRKFAEAENKPVDQSKPIERNEQAKIEEKPVEIGRSQNKSPVEVKKQIDDRKENVVSGNSGTEIFEKGDPLESEGPEGNSNEALSETEEVGEAATTAEADKKTENSEKLKTIDPTANMTQTEKELYELRQKMAKILEERDQEPKVDKIDINLKEEEKIVIEEKTREEIQRELASKLNEPEAPVVRGEDKTATDKVIQFIKSRKAIRWLFD